MLSIGGVPAIPIPVGVIFATSTPSVAALQQATRTLPIVFVMVADPVTSGFVSSLAKPGGNITGFPNFEYGIGTKWLELLKKFHPPLHALGSFEIRP
jgi:putative ABC transport system substrate-binding protein